MTRLLAKPQAVVLLALCSLGLGGEARALDPELTTPYQVHVVLRVAPNRLLTPIFKEQLHRDLQQGLQGALGAMGEVKVFDPADKDDPLWQRVAAEGLQAGLDKPVAGAPEVKTHFVTVDYVDGQYEIQGRQYDGLTGTATPAVRRERTPDRQFVARTAALLVDRDFGLVGTVMGGDDRTVSVAFKGGGLKVPLDRWVKKGDVLGVVQVGADGRTSRVLWTLLQADEDPDANGSCKCKLFQPQKRPLTAGGGSFRCIKLGTVKAPVRLRVVEPLPNGRVRVPESVVVYIGRQGFVDLSDPNVYGHGIEADGFYSTEQEKDKPLYDGVAFVTLVHAGQIRALVPLALVDDRTVTLPIKLGTEPPGFVTHRTQWERALLEEQVKLDGQFQSLNADLSKAGPAATLDGARKALGDLDKRIKDLSDEREELVKEAKPANGGKPPTLSTGDTRLQDVKKGRGELARWIDDLDKNVKEQRPGEAQEALTAVKQAQYAEKQADYEQAIELYEKAFAITKDAKLGARLDKLKKAWPTKDDEHAKARDFIYKTWPKLEPRAVTLERVKEAHAALDVCRKANDPFGPRKVHLVARRYLEQVIQELEELKPTIETVKADHDRAAELDQVGEKLNKLIEDAEKAIKEAPVP